MNKKQILPLLGILALLVIIPVATSYFMRNGFDLRIAALESDEPANVVVTDATSNSFRVSWITERKVIGAVKLENGQTFSESDSTSYHTLNVVGLQGSTDYKFSLSSGSKDFEKEYSQTTAQVVLGEEQFLIYGQVFSADGFSFQQGGVITLSLDTGSKQSQTLSTIINETGGFQFDLGRLYTNDLKAKFPYQQEATATVTIYTSHEQEGLEKMMPVNFTVNRQMQNIYLGEVNIDVIPGINGNQ